MKVLIGCEYSGAVRRAFRALGHDAWSYDLLPAEDGSAYHTQGDVLKAIAIEQWDLGIFHPPCTFLNMAGIRWLYKGGKKINGRDEARWAAMREAAAFYNALKAAKIPRIALENSKMHPYAVELCGKQTQIVQPHMFGHPEFKGISLQLHNLPKLRPTRQLAIPAHGTKTYAEWSVVHRASPGPDRWKDRSRTYQGVADAMAAQWGVLSE